MPNINNGSNRSFRYLQDARKHALDTVGSDKIIKTDAGYEVQDIDIEHERRLLDPLGLDPLGFESRRIEDVLASNLKAKGSAENVVEFLVDTGDNGNIRGDIRYVVQNDEVKAHEHRVYIDSEHLKSPEQKGLNLIQEVMLRGNEERLLKLTPEMVDALQTSQNLSADERAFVETKFNQNDFKTANRLFTQFFGQQTSYESAGVKTFSALVERLNNPENKANLDTMYDLGKHPGRFQTDYVGHDVPLTSMADTFKDLPGFKRYPQQRLENVDPKEARQKQREFGAALRTIDQYNYKFKLSHGMQFNRNGISGYQTELGYRFGNKTINIGVAGKDYDFNNPFDNNAGHGLNELRVDYRSPNFDLRSGVKRDDDGGFDIISPKSDWADRYIDDKLDQGRGWAEDNPWKAAGIGAGIVAGLWGYSYATGSDLSVDFDQRFNIINAENFRLRGEISPEIHLNGGMPDLGLHSVGLGAIGHKGELSYNVTLRHRFEDTTIGTGEINHKETDLNTRLSYRSYSLETANRWDHDGSQRIRSEIGVRKNFTLSDTSTAYLRPSVLLDNGSYDDAGIRAGWSKDFGKRFKVDLNTGYSEKQGMSAGFRTTYQF